MKRNFTMNTRNEVVKRPNVCINHNFNVDKGFPPMEFSTKSYENIKFNELALAHLKIHGGWPRVNSILHFSTFRMNCLT